jgi:hypothetical protein
VDKQIFETRLAEVAVLKKVKIARDPQGSRLVDDEPPTEFMVERTLPETRSCVYCDKTCNGQSCMNHTLKLVGNNKHDTKREWVTQCDSCKKKVDLKTGKIILPVAAGNNYVSQGLRIAKPGNRLGRPRRRDFWNEPVQIYTEDEAREISLKHAGMLDRLNELRNK